jgi:hypothetical protein
MRVDITENKQITQHFSTKEVRDVSHSAAKTVDYRLFNIAEIIRKYSGNAPVKISSAARTWGAKDSAHKRGNAFDLDLDENQLRSLRDTVSTWFPEAYSAGLRGFGTYWTTLKTFVHIDTESHNIKSRWLVDGQTYPLRYWNEGPAWFTRAGSASPDDVPSSIDVAKATPADPAELVDADNEKTTDGGLNLLVIPVLLLFSYLLFR